jgi:2-haloacid dehalogenase
MAIRALIFDVFGTLVDWRTSIISELRAFGDERGLADVDWEGLVDDWRGAYVPSMERVRSGAQPWTNLDALHRASFDELTARYGLLVLGERERAHCAQAWHRLRPWPEVPAVLRRLRRNFILAPLSNGNVSLLVDLARYAHLDFDTILSAELFRHYKPDPETYLGAAALLGCAPDEVLMVAAHNGDLHAAAAVGLKTAFIPRPAEYGPHQTTDFAAEAGTDFPVSDLDELADRLGC